MKKTSVIAVALPLLIAGTLLLYFAFTHETAPAPAGDGYTDLKLTGDFDRKWAYKESREPVSEMVASGNTVFATLDGVTAIDAESGEQLWSSPKHPNSRIAVGDGLLAVAEADGNLSAFDAATGELKWQASGFNIGPRAVAVSGDLVFASLSDGRNSSSSLIAYDNLGKEAWYKLYGARIKEIGVVGNTLFVVTEGGSDFSQRKSYLETYDRVTGAEKWSFPTFGMGIVATSGSGRIFVASESGLSNGSMILTALDAETGATIWQNSDHDFTNPLMANDRLFVGSVDNRSPAILLALDPKSGKELWTCGLPDAEAAQAPATVASGLVFFTGQGTINAADFETGQLRWRARLGGSVRVLPVVTDDSLCFTYGDSRTVYALMLPKVE